jgi:superfamily II DNA or RNA helicase
MGVIAKKFKEEFLRRDRRDFRKYKNLNDVQLEERMLRLPVRPPIWNKLTRLQKVCFIIGAETRKFAFWLDTGVGKTLLAISLILYFYKAGILESGVLVLVPNKVNKREWELEIEKHTPKTSKLILKGSSTEKWAQLENNSALFTIETYAGFARLACDRVEVENEDEDDEKKIEKYVPNPKKVKQLSKFFDAVVCDESVNVGHHTNLPFRLCRQLAKTSPVLFTMTGTPFNRDPTLMWAQMFLVDSGYTLGETLGLFRSIFCRETENYFSGAKEYKFDKKQQVLLNNLIAHRSISYPADEGSLPECVEIQKFVQLPDDAQAYYEKAREALIEAKGSFQETKNAFIRMRQISSGFMGYEDDETGERAKFAFPDNPKLDLLMSILKSINPEHKVIVFIDFNYSGERILKTLMEAKINSLLLYGKTKNPEHVRDSFVNDPAKRVLILQNKMGVGLNFQCAKYGIFFESPVSAIDRKQCRGRFVRQYSNNGTVFQYDLIMRDTADESVLEFHKEGGDLFEKIIRGRK